MIDYAPTQTIVLVITIINLVLILREMHLGRRKTVVTVPVLLWLISLLAFFGIQILDRVLCTDFMGHQSLEVWSLTLFLQGALAIMAELLSARECSSDCLVYREMQRAIDELSGR